jgi:hypothetical protein
MKVTDWYKWTRFKKRAGITLLIVGTFVSFGMEDGSMAYGVWGLVIAGTGVLITNTIRISEW